MPPKKAPASTPHAYAALDDFDLESASLETRSEVNKLNAKFNYLLSLQKYNSQTLKGLDTAVAGLTRLLEAKTANDGDLWSRPTESLAGPVVSESASLQTAMPVSAQYSTDATQSKDDSPPETRTPTEASTEQLARKKQQEGAAQASRAVRASEPVQQPLGEGQLEARKAKCEGFTATTNLPPASSPSNSPPNIVRPQPRTGITKQTTQWTQAYRSGDQAYTLEYATPTPEPQPPPLSLRTDASRFGWGAILLQRLSHM